MISVIFTIVQLQYGAVVLKYGNKSVYCMKTLINSFCDETAK